MEKTGGEESSTVETAPEAAVGTEEMGKAVEIELEAAVGTEEKVPGKVEAEPKVVEIEEAVAEREEVVKQVAEQVIEPAIEEIEVVSEPVVETQEMEVEEEVDEEIEMEKPGEREEKEPAAEDQEVEKEQVAEEIEKAETREVERTPEVEPKEMVTEPVIEEPEKMVMDPAIEKPEVVLIEEEDNVQMATLEEVLATSGLTPLRRSVVDDEEGTLQKRPRRILIDETEEIEEGTTGEKDVEEERLQKEGKRKGKELARPVPKKIKHASRSVVIIEPAPEAHEVPPPEEGSDDEERELRWGRQIKRKEERRHESLPYRTKTYIRTDDHLLQ